MKKIILLLFFGILLISSNAFAMGSPQSTNPNGPNYVPPASSSPAATSRTTHAGKNFYGIYRNVYLLSSAIDHAGPQIAGRLTGVSGQLFSYLAAIALVMFSIKELMFGDKGIKEFIIFFVFLAFARGLLAGYQLFFVQGVAVFFKDLGQKAAGTSSGPMTYFWTLFGHVYMDIGKASLSSGSLVGGVLLYLTGLGEIATALIFFLVTLIMLILALIVIGTIVLIHAYIAIALISGYIIVPFMIFKPLEFLWNGWLKFLITACFSYFLLYVVMALGMSSLDAVASSSALNASPATLGSVLAILFLIAIFAYLILKVPSIAGEIVSGMPNISFSGVVGVAMTVASVAAMGGGGGLKVAGKAAGAIRSAAGRGGKKE